MFVVLFVSVLTSNFVENCIGKGVNVGLCDPLMYGCKCGISATQVMLKIKQCTYFHRWKARCKPCKGVKPADLCSKFLNCEQCHIDGGGGECISCPPMKYGTWCEATCDCRNDATCDRNGRCICAEGFEGGRCERRKGCVPRQPVNAPLEENLHPLENPLTITYNCPSDFVLRGNAIATCLSNGQWSSSPPLCFPKCPLLSAPASGTLDYSQSDLVEGVTATVRCYQYHRLVGESEITCLPGGVWNSALPTCEQMPICPDPGITVYSIRQAEPPGSSQVGPFFEGMTLRYSCPNGFEQMGDHTIECLPEGIWTGEPPICVKVSRIIANCETKALDVLQENGVPVRLHCPPQCSQEQPNVWGTIIYTTNSTICPGAVHAGLVTNSGGIVEVVSNGIYPFFIGSNLNRIQTESLNEQSESFRFNKLPARTTRTKDENCPQGLVKIRDVCVYISSKLKTREEADAVCTNLGLSMDLPEFDEEEDMRNLTALLGTKGISHVWTNIVSMTPRNLAVNDEESNKNVSYEEELPKRKCGIVTFSNNHNTEDLVDCETKMNFICFQDFNSRALASCDEPDPLSNGDSTYIGKINGNFYVGSSIEYTCDPLHYMKGTPVISCTGNGTWSGEPPRCIEVITCDEPPIPIGGLVEYLLPRRSSPSQRKTFIHSASDSRLSRVPVGLEADVPEELKNTKAEPEPEIEDIELPPGKRKTGTRAVYECVSRYYELVGSRIRRCETGGRWSGRPPTCMPICGHSDSPRTPFIVNGNATDVGQWPWQAAISRWIPSLAQWYLICGGSLLNERWIITAAHCVTYPASDVLIKKERFKIYLGKYHRKDSKDDEYVQMKRVHEIHIHPDYDPSTFDSDIALILLETPVEFSSRTQPVCLPTDRTTRENLVEGNRGVVTGWGMTEKGTYSGTLQQAVLPVVSTETCEEGYIKAEFPLTVTENMFCAGYARGKVDSCSGDSGGPVVFLDPTTKEKRWVLEGIVSWGSPKGCGKPDQYGGFTTVSKYLDWIQLFF